MSILDNRLEAILKSVEVAYDGGSGMSSSSKGAERELFVDNILKSVFPPHYRFTSGDIVDSYGSQTGQLDLVLEKAEGYSFPMTSNGPRLFIAETVAAVIEVKSDLSSQWDEVRATATKVAKIKRKYDSDYLQDLIEQAKSGRMSFSPTVNKEQVIRSMEREAQAKENIGNTRIYFFAVGFEGWKKDDTLISKLESNVIDGILDIKGRKYVTKLGRAKGKELISGSKCLLQLFHWLELSFTKTANRWLSSGYTD